VNRLYGCIKPNATNFGLNYAASFVFPLQAFWNAIVYIITSQSAFRELLSHLPFMKSRLTSSSTSSSSPSSGNNNNNRKRTTSPSPSQVKLTRLRGSHNQKHPMGKPRRLRSNEHISGSSSVVDFLTTPEMGEEQKMQNLDRSRWSIESAEGRKFGR
jgi:hypothetical protein